MYYPDTALWIILAVMIVWSVASTVLVGLAQRFTVTRRNDGNSAPNAPLATPMHRALCPAKSAKLYFFLLLLGAVVVAGIDARAAQAFDAEAINAGAPVHAWCVTRDGSGVPACEYDNFVTCGIAAIAAGGSCKARSSLFAAAVDVPLPWPRKLSAAKPPLQKRAAAATMSGNDKLFRKFVRWSSEQHAAHATPSSPAAAPAAVPAQLAEAQSIIVVSAEPGPVPTSTNPAPTKAEPTKPEPAAAEPEAHQARAPGGWLIQIGAFDGEDEARQHLSKAQLKASTVLAAADPFTERVQKGDKVTTPLRPCRCGPPEIVS
jgi:cell division septation protein DedD